MTSSTPTRSSSPTCRRRSPSCTPTPALRRASRISTTGRSGPSKALRVWRRSTTSNRNSMRRFTSKTPRPRWPGECRHTDAWRRANLGSNRSRSGASRAADFGWPATPACTTRSSSKIGSTRSMRRSGSSWTPATGATSSANSFGLLTVQASRSRAALSSMCATRSSCVGSSSRHRRVGRISAGSCARVIDRSRCCTTALPSTASLCRHRSSASAPVTSWSDEPAMRGRGSAGGSTTSSSWPTT